MQSDRGPLLPEPQTGGRWTGSPRGGMVTFE